VINNNLIMMHQDDNKAP